jgi:hypothetical protein
LVTEVAVMDVVLVNVPVTVLSGVLESVAVTSPDGELEKVPMEMDGDTDSERCTVGLSLWWLKVSDREGIDNVQLTVWDRWKEPEDVMELEPGDSLMDVVSSPVILEEMVIGAVGIV